MTKVLVTGGTGTLGLPTVAALTAAGHQVRTLSRRPGPGVEVGDLLTGSGLDEATAGRATVIHLATTPRADARATANLIGAARSAQVEHLLYVSIVGVDDIPLRYYGRKRESEQLIAGSGVAFTILRSTQFHTLLARLFAAQRRLPLLLVPAIALQPVDVTEVARRLAELVDAGPSRRVADIGGPETLDVARFAEQWTRHHRGRRVVSVRPPGRVFAAYRAGHQLTAGPPWGRRTFSEFLTEQQPG